MTATGPKAERQGAKIAEADLRGDGLLGQQAPIAEVARLQDSRRGRFGAVSLTVIAHDDALLGEVFGVSC